MGGASSKQKKKKSNTKSRKSGTCIGAKRSSDGNIIPETKNQIYKGKKGGKQVKNVKIQELNTNGAKSASPLNSKKIFKSISFSEKSGTQISTPPTYRKKSMCVPYDAKDLNFAELRDKNRSASDKSLRFSHFTKLVRQTALYDWEILPVDIPLYGVPIPRIQSVCYICGVYTGSVTRACRICYQVYHDGCLMKIGHPLNKRARQLTEANSWSCHQCRVLSHLLTRGDVQEILGVLQDLQMNPDAITWEDYLKYYELNILGPVEKSLPDMFQSACETRFKEFAGDATIVEFDQFLDMVAINVLQKREQCSLVHILTEPELTAARTMYQQLEERTADQVTLKDAHSAIHEFDTNIKEMYRPIETFADSDDGKGSLVSWGEFLCTMAIHLLVQRPNYCLIDTINLMDKTQSFDSLDEAYKSCCSDFDGAGANQSKDTIEQEDKKSVSLLEEFTSALPFSRGDNVQAINSKDEKDPAQEDESNLESKSFSRRESHLWNWQQSRNRRNPTFSKPVNSFSKTDSSDNEESVVVLAESTNGDEKDCPDPRSSRRSEILVRPGNPDQSQKRRAVSQKVIIPSSGKLVDQVQQDD